MTYTKPDLVHTRGLRFNRRQLNVETLNPTFAAFALGIYTANPTHRMRIGTHAEYDKLVNAFATHAAS